MNHKSLENLNQFVKEHLIYLENARQDFQSKSEDLIANYMGIKYNESKMIMFLCKFNTIKWLESTLKNVIYINEWYERQLSKTIDSLEKSQVKHFLENVGSNSMCSNIESIFLHISELAMLLEVSRENFPKMFTFTSDSVSDITWMFNKKIDELNIIERKVQIIQDEMESLRDKVYLILYSDKTTSAVFVKQIIA